MPINTGYQIKVNGITYRDCDMDTATKLEDCKIVGYIGHVYGERTDGSVDQVYTCERATMASMMDAIDTWLTQHHV